MIPEVHNAVAQVLAGALPGVAIHPFPVGAPSVPYAMVRGGTPYWTATGFGSSSVAVDVRVALTAAAWPYEALTDHMDAALTALLTAGFAVDAPSAPDVNTEANELYTIIPVSVVWKDD